MANTKVNSALFKEEMRRNGYTLETLSVELGRSRTGLFNKIHNLSEFRASEIATIADLFKLNKAKKDAIFFAPDVE